MITETKTVYITDDGREFTDEKEARRHEAEIGVRKFCVDHFEGRENWAVHIADDLIEHADAVVALLRDLGKDAAPTAAPLQNIPFGWRIGITPDEVNDHAKHNGHRPLGHTSLIGRWLCMDSNGRLDWLSLKVSNGGIVNEQGYLAILSDVDKYLPLTHDGYPVKP